VKVASSKQWRYFLPEMKAVVVSLLQLGVILFGLWIMLGPLRPALRGVWEILVKAFKLLLALTEATLTGLLAVVKFLRGSAGKQKA